MKSTSKSHQGSPPGANGPKKSGPRKSIENRDLNTDKDTTNAYREKDWNESKFTDATAPDDRSIEDEEDRESKRKIEDANPAEDIQK